MSELPILYSFRRCPYAMRARMALKYAGVKVQLREVALRAKPPALLAISPKGTVPVLLRPGQAPLQESLDIIAWALSQHDPEEWLKDGHPDANAQAWVACNDGPFKRLLDLYKYAERHPDIPIGQSRDQAVALHLSGLERQLLQQPFLSGARRGWADLALLPFVRQFARVDEAWFDAAPLPALRRWLKAGLAEGLFVAAMHDKLVPWQDGDPPVVF